MAKRYLTTEQRRSALKLAYADREWVYKVDAMPPKQVYAIFDKLRKDEMINFDENGNIYFRSRQEVNDLKKKRKEAINGHQMTFDEWAKQENEKDIQKQRKTKEYIQNGKND